MWFEYFHEQFETLASDLGIVLDANGCREGWLQGELFRRSPDQTFAVNTYKYEDSRCKADFEGLRPSIMGGEAPMVAELKVMRGDFAKKCLDGKSWTDEAILDNYRQGSDGRIRPRLREIDQASGHSILSDVRRLRTVKDRPFRYMILVRSYYRDDTAFGFIIKNIKLSDVEETWRYPEYGFDVRIWAI